ncbi:MAG: ribosomal RNA small subunit methyltransferase A [Spirochaetes bacterium GWB1_48_6]|nr:MAG: ribosomal RNA small subunit methyltransferase A [Spirochaetes bacterium GWB1_48_6]
MNAPVNYDSPKEIRELLDSLGFNTLKRWGQNFLINGGVRQKIVAELELTPGEPVWEIGPGLGSMTYGMLAAGHPVTVFEIDPGYCQFLKDKFQGLPLTIVYGDVLKTWEAQAALCTGPIKIMGNLPYNAASAILGDFTDKGFLPPLGIFMVQKEMAMRLTAKVGEKNYSSFSVAIQTFFEVQSRMEVRPGSFFPPPEVTSTVVRLVPHGRHKVADPIKYSQLVRESFSSRRKTLRNNIVNICRVSGLDPLLVAKAFEDRGVDLSRRSETLPPEDFVAVAETLFL